jgi:hypothetical protein
MIKEEIIERVVKETKQIWTCDICGSHASATCENCKKDLCSRHIHYGDDSGDYPDKFCPECHRRYLHFKEIESGYNKQIDEEYERIMKGKTIPTLVSVIEQTIIKKLKNVINNLGTLGTLSHDMYNCGVVDGLQRAINIASNFEEKQNECKTNIHL